MIIRDNKSMQETQPRQLASAESDPPTFKGNTFVRAVGGKARSFLKALEHSFSSSTTERGEDLSYMTIEFLYTRLQAQRTVYKAEKQRVQQLVKKVMELEQKLNLEIARRKKAEGDNVLVSSKYDLRTEDSPYCKTTSCMMNKEGEEKGGWISGIKNQIDGGAGHHTDGGEGHRSNCKQVPFQHWSFVDKQSNATFNQNSSEISVQKGTRESMDSEPHFKETEVHFMLEMTQRNLNSKDDKYGADSRSEVYEIDIEDLEESDGNKGTFLETPGLSQRFPPRKTMSIRQPANNSSKESLDCSSLGSSSNLASEGELFQKCSARAISSPRDYHERVLEGIMSSPKKMNLGDFTDLPISSPSPRKHSLYNNRLALKLVDECSLHEYITAESESSKEIEEDSQVGRQQDFEGYFLVMACIGINMSPEPTDECMWVECFDGKKVFEGIPG